MHPILENAFSTTRKYGFTAFLNVVYSYAVTKGFQTSARLRGRETYGEHIFERNWDVLVLLDACRHDALTEVASEYDFLPSSFGTLHTCGSSSGQWMRCTFAHEQYPHELNETAYVTGNPHSVEYIDGDELALLDEVWRRAWDTDVGTIQPRPVTNAAIRAGRNASWNRLIVHYMQPHYPFVPHPDVGEGYIYSDVSKSQDGQNAFRLLRVGELSYEEVWDAYIDNLRYVLDDVKVLVENIDAESLIISADHGELFGEYGMIEHPHSVQVEPLRDVPWAETTAEDTETHTPPAEETIGSTPSRDEQLRSLGYR